MVRVRRPPARAARTDAPACSGCTLLTVCAALILVCLIGYIPIMFNVKTAPRFDWGPTVDRNTSRYIRPEENTTLLQPAGHSATSCRPFLLIVVHSAVKNFPARNAIRETWGGHSELPPDVLLRFLVGTVPNSSLSENLIAENEVHGDLVQQDFVDVYSNLTLKSVMMLKWATGSCQPAHMLKTDDDMFINVPNLYAYLKATGRPDRIQGALICRAQPMLSRFSKYYSPRHMFASRHFPSYVSGTAYALGGEVAARLYAVALATPLFHLEDVFITGMCAAKLGVRPVDHVGFSFWRRALDACEFRRVVSAHEVTPDELLAVWREIKSPGMEARCAAAPAVKPRALVKCRP